MASNRKERRLRRRIRQIRRRHPHHWKNAVWAWSNRGKGTLRRKIRRFRAYHAYAADVERWLRKQNKHPGKWDAIREMNKIQRETEKKLKVLRERREDQKPEPVPSQGSCKSTYDGKTVPSWMVPWLNKIRAAGWDGVVVSGVRTSAYSQYLCCQMCSACAPGTTCPGQCAGIYSNHNCDVCCFPKGALDVSDYITFRDLARRVGAPFWNALPVTDPVHFSNSGR